MLQLIQGLKKDLPFLWFVANLSIQKSSWGKEGINLKMSRVSREDASSNKVNKRNGLIFVIVS